MSIISPFEARDSSAPDAIMDKKSKPNKPKMIENPNEIQETPPVAPITQINASALTSAFDPLPEKKVRKKYKTRKDKGQKHVMH